MAEAVIGGAFLSAFLDVIFKRLTSPEVANLIHGNKLDKKLLQRLETTLKVVRTVLNDAEKKQIRDSDVNNWLNDLKDAVYVADDLLDEVSTKTVTQKEVTNPFFRLFNLQDREMVSSCLSISMKTLHIEDFRKLEFTKQHNHKLLESLPIHNSCDSLTSLPLDIFPNLKRLYISNCENLESLLVSQSHDFILQNLTSFEIRECPNLVSLSSQGLPAPNMTRFLISKCKKLKSLPHQMNILLPKLEYFRLENCPEIGSFPESGMPPKLRSIRITNCTKLLSGPSWPSMDMLTDVTIEGPCDAIKSFPKEGLLHASLKSLTLLTFSSLEMLDCKGLRHLTSLQQLRINDCPKLENMVGVETLPASILNLCIIGCPLLKEKCHMKHPQIWNKISHIKDISVDHKRIS
ncbi:hypothetical protein P8452_19291 [Trifolium repens]|nr:hypothetical protein P8452_19291 [Trifolium repens]